MALTSTYYKAQIRRDVGDGGNNAQYELLLPVEATGGTFTLSVGNATTGNLNFGASAAVVQSALEGLSTVGAGNVQVDLARRGYLVEFIGDLAAQPVPLDASGDNLTPSGEVVARSVQEGKRSYFSDTAIDNFWERAARADTNLEYRFYVAKYYALDDLRGKGWPLVNKQVGDEETAYSDAVKALERMLDDTLAWITAYESGAQSEGGVASGQTHYGKLTNVTPSGKPYPFLSGRQQGRY